MTTGDDLIISAMKENQENGFRLLMAKYKKPVYWHIRRLVVSLRCSRCSTGNIRAGIPFLRPVPEQEFFFRLDLQDRNE